MTTLSTVWANTSVSAFLFYWLFQTFNPLFYIIFCRIAMLKFKCWYYEQAIKDGSEDRLKSLIPDRLPEKIRKAYENAHR